MIAEQLDYVFWCNTEGVLSHATFRTEQPQLHKQIREFLPFSTAYWLFDENFGWFEGFSAQPEILSRDWQHVPKEIMVLATLINLNWRI